MAEEEIDNDPRFATDNLLQILTTLLQSLGYEM